MNRLNNINICQYVSNTKINIIEGKRGHFLPKLLDGEILQPFEDRNLEFVTWPTPNMHLKKRDMMAAIRAVDSITGHRV